MIVGFSIDSISAKRNDSVVKAGNELNVNTIPTITEVEAVDTINEKDAIRFGFTFECKYTPDVGEIFLEGNLLWKGKDEKQMLDVVDIWKKKRLIHVDATLEVMNTVFRRCLAKAITLTDELRLPPPLQFPIVKISKEGKTEEQPQEVG